jgi:hypothetical protein
MVVLHRTSIHAVPTTSRLARRRRMLVAGTCARSRVIRALRRAGVEQPRPSMTLHTKGHPDAAGHNGEHEIVHLGPADRPGGPITGEQPRSGQAQKPDQTRQSPILAQADMRDDALQPTPGRGGVHRSRPLAGEVAEVHTAGADQGHDNQAERLQTARAQVTLGAQTSHEGG